MTETEQKEYEAEMEKMRKAETAENSKIITKKQKLNLSGVTLFLTVWSLVTTLILLVIGWNFLQSSVYESGVKSGAQTAAAQIYTDMINKAANDSCNTIFVQYDNRRVDLVNVRCLQAVGQQDAKANDANSAQSSDASSTQN